MNITKYIVLTFLLLAGAAAFAKRTVEVSPDSLGALNFAIIGDTLEAGGRIDSNTVYILRRNAVYKTVGEIRNPGFNLTIRAEEGNGARPIIQPAVVTGGISVRPFTALGNLTLEGLYITSIDDLGTYINRIIRAQADSLRIILRDCWFDGTGQSVLRFDNVGGKAYMENCIASHIGRTFVPNNGRIVDFRTNGDSLIVRNNTIFNVTQRLMRVTSGRAVRYAEFSNNTIVNVAQLLTDFEECFEAKFVDNLVVNGVFEGTARGGEQVDLVLLTRENASLLNVNENDQSIEITNNWFYTTPDVEEVWADSLTAVPFYDSNLVTISGIDSLSLIAPPFTFTGTVRFKNPPPLPQNVVVGMIFDQLFADNLDNGSAPNWNFTSSPFFRVIDASLPFPWELPFDFSYSPTDGPATASTTGGQLGDPRWELEDFSIVTGLEELSERQPMVLFPNPTRDIFKVVMRENRILRRLEVMDARGIAIYTRLGKDFDPVVDISSFKSGIYFVSATDRSGRTYVQRLIKN